MLIKEVCKNCSLTKKAIEYYEKQGLVRPKISENGYRSYSMEDIAILKEISVLRKLELSIPDIQNILNSTNKAVTLSKCKYLMELKIEKERLQWNYMEYLINHYDIEGVFNALRDSIDEFFTIKEKLVQAFPGTYGIYINIHFGSFLDGKIDSVEKEDAYRKIIRFLDGVKDLNISPELEEYLGNIFLTMPKTEIKRMNTMFREAISDVDNYIDNNKGTIEEFMKFRASKEYKETQAYKIQKLLIDFEQNSGYHEIFLPNLKILSPSYLEYVEKLKNANEVFNERLPELRNLYS